MSEALKNQAQRRTNLYPDYPCTAQDHKRLTTEILQILSLKRNRLLAEFLAIISDHALFDLTTATSELSETPFQYI